MWEARGPSLRQFCPSRALNDEEARRPEEKAGRCPRGKGSWPGEGQLCHKEQGPRVQAQLGGRQEPVTHILPGSHTQEFGFIPSLGLCCGLILRKRGHPHPPSSDSDAFREDGVPLLASGKSRQRARSAQQVRGPLRPSRVGLAWESADCIVRAGRWTLGKCQGGGTRVWGGVGTRPRTRLGSQR